MATREFAVAPYATALLGASQRAVESTKPRSSVDGAAVAVGRTIVPRPAAATTNVPNAAAASVRLSGDHTPFTSTSLRPLCSTDPSSHRGETLGVNAAPCPRDCGAGTGTYLARCARTDRGGPDDATCPARADRSLRRLTPYLRTRQRRRRWA